MIMEKFYYIVVVVVIVIKMMTIFQSKKMYLNLEKRSLKFIKGGEI